MAAEAGQENAAPRGEGHGASGGDWIASRRRDLIDRMNRRFEAIIAAGGALLPGKGARAAAAGEPHERRAGLKLHMTAREFLRLQLGAAVLGVDQEDLVLRALEAYLDACGVETFSDCTCQGGKHIAVVKPAAAE